MIHIYVFKIRFTVTTGIFEMLENSLIGTMWNFAAKWITYVVIIILCYKVLNAITTRTSL
jgi:hypothetical protein